MLLKVKTLSQASIWWGRWQKSPIFDGGREKTHHNCNASLQRLPLSHLRWQVSPVGSVGAFESEKMPQASPFRQRGGGSTNVEPVGIEKHRLNVTPKYIFRIINQSPVCYADSPLYPKGAFLNLVSILIRLSRWAILSLYKITKCRVFTLCSMEKLTKLTKHRWQKQKSL